MIRKPDAASHWSTSRSASGQRFSSGQYWQRGFPKLWFKPWADLGQNTLGCHWTRPVPHCLWLACPLFSCKSHRTEHAVIAKFHLGFTAIAPFNHPKVLLYLVSHGRHQTHELTRAVSAVRQSSHTMHAMGTTSWRNNRERETVVSQQCEVSCN